MPLKKSIVKKSRVLTEDELEENELKGIDELEEDADSKAEDETLGDDDEEEASWEDDDDWSGDEEEK